MIDGYMHLDLQAAAPLSDLRRRLEQSGQDGALLVETWDGRNRNLMVHAQAVALPGIRYAYCFRGQDGPLLDELLAGPNVMALRADTAALARDDFPAARLAADGTWLLGHAEEGIAALARRLQHWTRQCPALRVYVPHLGWPRRNGADEADWADAMQGLAAIPTVIAGVSALAHFSREAFPHEDMQPCVEHLCRLFGARRIVLGSDYPNSGAVLYAPLHALGARWVAGALPDWDPHHDALQR